MIIGRVTGTLVSTNKSPSLSGAKMLIVQPVDLLSGKLGEDYIICIDDVDAGEGDLVFGAYGSSSRQTDSSAKFASDYTIYGIIDSAEYHGARIYDKAKED